MKKVLIVTTISGFLPQFEENDVRILQQYGYEVHYASNFHNPVYEVNEEALRREGLVLHQIDIQKSPGSICANLRAFFQLKEIIRTERISLVHCHNPMGGVLGRLAAFMQKQRVFVFYTAHGFHFYAGAGAKCWMLYFTAERILAHITDRLITINTEDYLRAEHFRMRKGGRVARIPGVGLDVKKYATPVRTRSEVRRDIEIPEDAFYILSVGELNRNKNHSVILQAIASLEHDNVYYGICGRGMLADELLRSAEEHGLKDRFRLLGFRNDIPDMLAAADCFAFPSEREGLGMAALEAMAAGLPVISSDCRGTREYMNNGINGIVCKTGMVAEYAMAIRMLQENPEMRTRMAEAGVRTAETFGLPVTDRIMRELYGEIGRAG